MNFCEKCNGAFEDERCPACGNKKVRQVRDEDYCFLIEKGVHQCEVLMSVLDANDIHYSAMPFGSGVESYFGMSLSNYRIYVPYGSLETARGILRDVEAQKTEEWRALLLENAELLKILPKAEKKIRKKLKLPDDVDFIAYCIEIVKNASKIVGEAILGAQWYYVYCYSGDTLITFNSETYEILSLRKRK